MSDDVVQIIEMLEEFGRTVQLQGNSNTPDDPAKPWRGTSGGTPVDAIAVMMDYSKKKPQNDLPRTGYQMAYVDPSIPLASLEDYDEMIDGGETWEIVEWEKIHPGDEILLYKLFLRR